MTKVYPNTASVSGEYPSEKASTDGVAVVLTVWKKSLLLNCNGFTVFDGQGNLIFRVDNYVAGNKDEVLLMDAAGKPLLTIRRNGKKLSFGDKWLVFEGETAVEPRFSATKHVNILNTRCLARVISSGIGTDNEGEDKPACEGSSWGWANRNTNDKNKNYKKGTRMEYEIEGSYAQRCCSVYDNKRRRVAEIKRKEAAAGGVAFGADVFRLIVQPDMDATLTMAFVILLDKMYRST